MSQQQRLDIRQSQTLTITPQLQQSLKLLQLSSLELAEYIAEELEKNPLLSADQDSFEQEDSKKNEIEDEVDNEPDITVLTSQREFDDVGESKEEAREDTRSDNLWNGDEIYENNHSQYYVETSHDGEENGSEKFVSSNKTLREHIQEQINLTFHDPSKRLLAHTLLDNLDDSGYLGADLDLLQENLGVSDDDIEDVIAELQEFDPPGIFARSLKECLEMQIRDRGGLDFIMQNILENLDLVAKGDLEGIAKGLNVHVDVIKEAVQEIKLLNPKPGLNFESEPMTILEPDVILTRKQNGDWHIELNNNTLPRVLANKSYYESISKRTDSDTKKYIQNQWTQASWLIKALNQRAETLLKVSTELVAKQSEFFEKGIYYLKPMIYRDIAEKIEMHESTIGRAIANKFIMTPRGMFAMKYFFTSSVKGSARNQESDGTVSSEVVKQYIKEIINQESDGVALSDDTISEILSKRGIEAARRTVAKYRESMSIPPSSIRRRFKKN